MYVKSGTLNLSAGEGTKDGTVTRVYSAIYDVSRENMSGNFNLWTHIRGDSGVSGASTRITWDGCWKRSGSTYVTPTGTPHIRIAGTSVNGATSGTTGTDASSFSPDLFPFIRINAAHNAAATTTAVYVDYALIYD